ncbi:spermatogenesis associated 6-like protein isoform X1 [Artibeus jamaicensis]|uniref:spermatogenesis associated 6-like protein isoform X1 n=1 Tax=Artibeus jamaicensis TaxID=9417 RepID=UPI00235A7E55|nr:spermatogenesis associated 6-like protein isoform X1 [Artibeus jamaicensis]XP_053512089.1 spermatogenesis associated 6-like protein isoform X1 [Artibeus jamaicensis]XP_053512090.1 spermatogenesis associated 6-like protein isoform X1 [Artibeus jamaicensis]
MIALLDRVILEGTMPMEVVVELQIRAISCPGVFLPDKQDVYLGVYLLNQYLETDCFPSVFPVTIQQRMKFKKLFENAIDPGAVADILESFLTRFELIQLVPPVWEELAYYEENTREFLFPEPKLTPPNPGMCREVLMKTAAGFPGIAPKIEFSTRTAIRECVLLHRNRFLEESCKSRSPLSTPYGPKFPSNNTHGKPKEHNLNKSPQSMQARVPSPYSTRRFFQDQPAPEKISRESKPPFVVRHVDSAKPFGEDISEHHSGKSRRKSKFSHFPFPTRRASSLDSHAANIKVIKEPDERIVLRNESPSRLDSSKFGKPSPSYDNQGDASCRLETSFATSRHSRSPSPRLDRPPHRARFHPGSQSTWKKIHERVCSLLTSHRARQRLNEEDFISEVSHTLERPNYPLKNYPVRAQRYF